MGGSGFGINTMKELAADKPAATVQSYHGNNDLQHFANSTSQRIKQQFNEPHFSLYLNDSFFFFVFKWFNYLLLLL